VFNHLVLTTYYSASLPCVLIQYHVPPSYHYFFHSTSLFFWLVMVAGSALTVIVAEQLCVRREMTEGLIIKPIQEHDESEEMEMGGLLRQD